VRERDASGHERKHEQLHGLRDGTRLCDSVSPMCTDACLHCSGQIGV
jgi:hypothetical protein